jgi:hypothetical protein
MINERAARPVRTKRKTKGPPALWLAHDRVTGCSVDEMSEVHHHAMP